MFRGIVQILLQTNTSSFPSPNRHFSLKVRRGWYLRNLNTIKSCENRESDQHLKALFIHFMQFCFPTQNSHSNTIRSSFEMTQNHVSNIFYHFHSAISLGSRASKMPANFRQNRKIYFPDLGLLPYFQNTEPKFNHNA